ncbi:DUF938 domain-containing protein [Poseidonocella sp. HB161398]|uniref:DUF938 domain-containing protein n=1 Tax=Poseidonocella sp. HB161398 TaxID=2320855 RepID=UPI0011098237|nr:DUF938 domain-containing protein [Poseidonocella sp. HB161398]
MARHIVQEAAEATDGRRTAPAALRNAGPLIAALQARLPSQGRVLEVASGTGQHAAAFAAAFPALSWTPSDVDPGQRDSIAAWRRASGLANLDAPLAIDIAAPWPVPPRSVQAVLAINLLHLVPGTALPPLFEGARAALEGGGRMIVYGPFLRGAVYASEGDRDFDAALRARDPAIGYKPVEAVSGAARAAGLSPVATDAMPANNLLLTFAAP